MITRLVGLAVIGVAIFGSPVQAQTLELRADLTGAAEVPSTDSGAHGEAALKFDTNTNQLSYTITYDGLSGPATEADVRGPADSSTSGPQVISFPIPDSPITGTATLNKAQAAALSADRLYIEVHSQRYPNGEIRGQIEH